MTDTLNPARLDVGSRNPYAELLRLAWPMILMMVSRLAMTLIDFAMVSQLGTDAQAAVMPASIMAFVLSCVGMGVVMSVQTFVSQADGLGKPEEGSAYVRQSLHVTLVAGLLSIPLALTAPYWMNAIGKWGGHDAEVLRLEIEYVSYAVLIVAPSTLSAALNCFFMGVQRPLISLAAVIISTGANALGNYALIFGHFGFPEMGVKGAAIATVIGWAVRAAVMAVVFLAPAMNRRYKTRGSIAPSWSRLRGMLYVGLPTAVQWLIDVGCWSVFTVFIIPSYGKTALAATNVAVQYIHLSFMPAVGIGMAMTTQVGYAIGKRDHSLAEKSVRTGRTLTCVYMGFIGLLMACAGRPLMQVFTQDAAVISAGVFILFWAALFQIFDAMQITYLSALRGAGDTRMPAVLSAASAWGVQVGGGLIMARWFPGFGPAGPWAMCALCITICGAGFWLRWRLGSWKDIRLFGADEQPAAAVIAEAVPCEAPVGAE